MASITEIIASVVMLSAAVVLVCVDNVPCGVDVLGRIFEQPEIEFKAHPGFDTPEGLSPSPPSFSQPQLLPHHGSTLSPDAGAMSPTVAPKILLQPAPVTP
jgi:hypothetical protein